MCDVLEVSPSGYYDWEDRSASARCERHRQLVTEIKVIHQRSRCIYGSSRVHEELIDNGVVVGKNTVAKLMRHYKIQSKVHKRFVVTTNSRHNMEPAENLLNQDFSADKPNQKWVSDTTFIPTREGWLFLARLLVSYSVGIFLGVSIVFFSSCISLNLSLTD